MSFFGKLFDNISDFFRSFWIGAEPIVTAWAKELGRAGVFVVAQAVKNAALMPNATGAQKRDAALEAIAEGLEKVAINASQKAVNGILELEVSKLMK